MFPFFIPDLLSYAGAELMSKQDVHCLFQSPSPVDTNTVSAVTVDTNYPCFSSNEPSNNVLGFATVHCFVSLYLKAFLNCFLANKTTIMM